MLNPCYVEYHEKQGEGLGLLHLASTAIKIERFDTIEDADAFIKDLREDPSVKFIEFWGATNKGWKLYETIDLS